MPRGESVGVALPRRLDKREREAILYARMVDWEYQDEKRRRYRKDAAKRRVKALAAPRAPA